MEYPGLEQYMKNHDLSLRRFAEMCGMPSSVMCRILNGKTEPRKGTIDRIVRTTGLTYEECFKEDNYENEKG